MSKNFRKLVIQFGNREKAYNVFKKLENWKVSKKNTAGIDYILFEGYGDTVAFPAPEFDSKLMHSSNVLNQDRKMVEYDDNNQNFNLKLNDDILFKLNKDISNTYNQIFSEDSEYEYPSDIYDDSIIVSIALSENDLA